MMLANQFEGLIEIAFEGAITNRVQCRAVKAATLGVDVTQANSCDRKLALFKGTNEFYLAFIY